MCLHPIRCGSRRNPKAGSTHQAGPRRSFGALGSQGTSPPKSLHWRRLPRSATWRGTRGAATRASLEGGILPRATRRVKEQAARPPVSRWQARCLPCGLGVAAPFLLDWPLIIPCSLLGIRLLPIHLIHPPSEANGSDAATAAKQVSHAPRTTGHSAVLSRGVEYKESMRPQFPRRVRLPHRADHLLRRSLDRRALRRPRRRRARGPSYRAVMLGQ